NAVAPSASSSNRPRVLLSRTAVIPILVYIDAHLRPCTCSFKASTAVEQPAASALEQIGIGRMLADPGVDEGALRHDFQSLRAHLIERTLDQGGADALAAELGRHLGVPEGDDVAEALVVGRGEVTVDFKLEAVLFRVVVNRTRHIVHSVIWLWLLCKIVPRRSCKRRTGSHVLIKTYARCGRTGRLNIGV